MIQLKRPIISSQRGFTLPELLTVVAIIGTLSSIGVVSYESARVSSRDVKRVSDLKQVQSALELFFENHSYYPGDGFAGSEGSIIGLPQTRFLTDVGFKPQEEGRLYMIIPKNPSPGGSPYVYRAMDRAGADCETDICDSYAVLFTLEKGQGSYLAGGHAVTPTGIVGAEGGGAGKGVSSAGGELIGIEGVQAQLANSAELAAKAVADLIADERVQTVAEVAVAPVATAAAVVTTVLSTTSLASYASFLLTQPFILFGLRRRKKWGTVINSLSRIGVDLAIVRMRDAATGRVLKSTVTDAAGRFSFLAQAGTYRLEVAKHGIVFPSIITAGKREAGQFTELYHGEDIVVGAEGAVLTPNIPVDPIADEAGDEIIATRDRKRRFRHAVAGMSPVFGAAALLIRPSLLTGLMFAAQMVTYALFRRLATSSQPKNWGIVYDQGTNKPVPEAVARVFEAKYNKLLESQVTDQQGRYHFRVGGNTYFLTVTKKGYQKTETTPIDLSAIKEPTIIASNLPLKRVEAAPEQPVQLTPVEPAAPDSSASA